jgi:ribosomal protein L13
MCDKVTTEEEVKDRMAEKQGADRFVNAIFTMTIPSMLPAWAGRGACAMNQCRVAMIAL